MCGPDPATSGHPGLKAPTSAFLLQAHLLHARADILIRVGLTDRAVSLLLVTHNGLIMLLELTPRVLHEKTVLHEHTVVGGLEGDAGLLGELEMNERVAIVKNEALDYLAVGLEAFADLLLGTGLGEVTDVHDLRVIDVVEDDGRLLAGERRARGTTRQRRDRQTSICPECH